MKRLRWCDHISVNLFWLGLNIRNTAIGSVFTPFLVATFVPEARMNTALGTDLIPAGEAGRYLGISNLAGAGAGMIGKGIGGPVADYLNGYRPGLGYFAIFAAYILLFVGSTVSLAGVRRWQT